MYERKSKVSLILIALLVINLSVSAFFAVYLFMPNESGNGTLVFEEAEKSKHVLYIGTNDKDTYEQVIDTEKAIELVNTICVKNKAGFTVTEAKGGWEEEGKLLQENTLVYTIVGATEKQIISIMDDVRKELNQNSILLEELDTRSLYYYGAE